MFSQKSSLGIIKIVRITFRIFCRRKEKGFSRSYLQNNKKIPHQFLFKVYITQTRKYFDEKANRQISKYSHKARYKFQVLRRRLILLENKFTNTIFCDKFKVNKSFMSEILCLVREHEIASLTDSNGIIRKS